MDHRIPHAPRTMRVSGPQWTKDQNTADSFNSDEVIFLSQV